MASAAQLVSLRRAAGYNVLATSGVLLVAVFVLCALFAPWVAPQDAARIDLPARLMGPSTSHWFGTDELGRDILSRIIYGARISMLVGSCVVAASLTLGMIFGSIAGYYGGVTDRVLNVVVMNAFMSFPGILLAIAFVAFLGPGIFNLVFALSLGGWVGYARARRQRRAHRGTAYMAEHYSADHRAGCDWHGRGHSGGSHDELPRIGRTSSSGQLGLDAKRRAFAPVRFAVPGAVPGRRGHARGAFLQFHRRRAARLPRSAIQDRGGDVAAAYRIQAVTFTGVVCVLLVLLDALDPNCCQICCIVANACCAAERLPACKACPNWLSA